jgi:hypothetical protein
MSNVTRTVQDEVRPRLTRVEDRGQQLKTLGPAAAQLVPGTAVAVLGSPGVSLHRLAADVIRGIPDPTLIVWLDLSELSRAVAASDPPGDLTMAGGVWDQALDAALISAFEQALVAEGLRREELSFDNGGDLEEPGVARIQRFANLSRKLRRWPVVAVEAMHRLPWPVSERLQWTLRKALDNGERQALLRLVLTGSSDFLSGEAIAEGAGFSTSPLYARTARYEVLPFTVEQLYELTPMPGGLPDRLLEVLMTITGGGVGLFELFFDAIVDDPSLGQALLESLPETGPAPELWLWDWISRADGVAIGARQLVREGLGALLSSPKGRSWQIVEALQSLLNGEPVEEAAADALLPLELAGLAALDGLNGRYRYRFASPLVPPLLRAVLPAGRRLRDQLEVFSHNFSWEEPGAEPPPEPLPVRVTGDGSRRHVTAPVPPTLQPPITPEPPRRTPLELTVDVARMVADSSASTARALIALLRDIGLATEQARKDRNTAILTFAQLDIRWISYANGVLADAGAAVVPGAVAAGVAAAGGVGAGVGAGGGLAAAAAGGGPAAGGAPAVVAPSGVPTLFAPAAPPIPGAPLLGRWDVRVLPPHDDDAHLLEAAALFVPPERLKEWFDARSTGVAFVPKSSDDAFAMGLMAGMLLGREPDARLVVERIEQRLTGAQELGIGALLRLVRRCLDPVPRRRPTHDIIVNVLEEVLADPYRTPRNIVRVMSLTAMATVVAVGLFDFALDTRVSNPNWAYTGVKLVGAGVWAAFYVLAWLILGRSNREQINEQLWAFLRQRLNRIRWMAGPALIAVVFSGIFAYRLNWNWGVQLTLLPGQKLVEIEERVGSSDTCETTHKFAEPASGALVRLRLDDREYVFIVDQEVPGRGSVRTQLYWPAEQVRKQRNRPWGDALHIYLLSPAPPEKRCLPEAQLPEAQPPGAPPP